MQQNVGLSLLKITHLLTSASLYSLTNPYQVQGDGIFCRWSYCLELPATQYSSYDRPYCNFYKYKYKTNL